MSEKRCSETPFDSQYVKGFKRLAKLLSLLSLLSNFSITLREIELENISVNNM